MLGVICGSCQEILKEGEKSRFRYCASLISASRWEGGTNLAFMYQYNEKGI